MVNEATKFPAFPTTYTEKEQKRLTKLAEQRKEVERIYQAKFTPEAWAEVSPPERAVRELLPSWLSPVVRAATPWEQGTWDIGFTPEQAQEYRFEMEEEYKELARQEKITRLLPDIQADLMVAALAGEPISDITELLSDFPELRTDFTEEEVGYLSNLSQSLLHASPEDILSGKVFAYDPSQLPITQEDIEALGRKAPKLDPRHIFSTVAFSKDLEEIGAALQQAYPPAGDVTEEEVGEDTRQRLLEYFKRRNVELGITPKEGESVKDTAKRAHEKIAEEEGELLTLKDEESGNLVAARVKSDGTVWIGEDLLGAFDREQGRIVPLSPRTGKPLLTEEAQEGELKDLWDSFYLGAQRAWHGTKQGLLLALKEAIAPKKITVEGEEVEVGGEGWPGQKKLYENLVEAINRNQDIRQAEYEVWLEEHPELAPKPEYTQSPIEHTELLKDPMYYAYTIISNAPIIGASLTVGLATTLATKNPWAGAVAGAAIITPTQINEVYEDLIASGASPENATELSTSVGVAIGAVEVLPGMIVLKSVSPVFMRLFRREFQRELSTQVVKRLTVKGIFGTATKIEIAETLEEVVQTAMQNAAVKTVDENRSVLENIPETAIQAAIAVAPLAIFGGGAEYVSMKQNLPKATQDKIDTTTKDMVDAGLTPEHAEAVAFSKVVETEKGQAEVEMATEKAIEVAPSAQVQKLEKTLETINSDIDAFTTSIPAQEERLAKMKAAGELPSMQAEQSNKIDGMKEQVADLEAKKKVYDAELKAIKKAPTLPTVPGAMPVIPEQDIGLGERVNEEGEVIIDFEARKRFENELSDLAKTVTIELSPDRKSNLDIEIRRWIASRNNETLQTIGHIATQSPEYLARMRAKLREQYPTDHVLLHRGKGQARERALEREFTNVTSSRKTAINFEETWSAGPPPGTKPSIDSVLVRVDDIVAVGAVPESELIISSEILKDRISNPLTKEGEFLEGLAPSLVTEQLVTPDPDVGRELTPDGRPRLKDWGDDQADTAEAIKAMPSILKHIASPTAIKEAAVEAEKNLEDLHSRLEAAETPEAEKVVTDEFEELARKSKLRKKKLLASHWDDLGPPEQSSLILAAIPDKSITFSIKKEIFDIRYYMQFLEEETGLPFYKVFKRAELSHGAARVAQEKMLIRIGADHRFDHIRTDAEAKTRVAQELNSRNPRLRIESPEGLTDQEKLLADVLEEQYKEDEPKVRYIRFMRTAPSMDSLKTAFPDAVEAGKELELELALGLRNNGELDGLYSFLETCDWGVIGSGYDPWIVSYPSLVPTRVTLGTTRGAARLMRRESVEFPQGMEKDVLLRRATYMKQLEAQWRLEPELDVLEDMWSQAGDKIANSGQVESALREWTRELQGIPTRQSFFDSVLRRVWRQAMSSVFLHPWMSFRNLHQAIAFHPDRTELFKLLVQKPSAAVQEKSKVYYDTFVSQLKGIRRDWLYAGEKGIPGLGWPTRLADSLSLYSHSDNIPRRWSFQASANKALRATERYKEDGDVKKWLKSSGAVHLRQTERNYALELLAQPTFDLAVPGLREVSGGEMASMYVGHEVANMTHFIYERAFRAPVEMGSTGRTLYNLIVFPRGYFQRTFFQAKKLPNLTELFSEGTDWIQARAGFKDLTLLLIVGSMMSEWLKKVAGKRKRPYNPLDIIQWQLGGLVLGVGMDVTELIGNVITIADPTTDPEIRDSILGGLPGKLSRQADTLVPFYRNLLDSFEAFAPFDWLGSNKDIDRHLIRQLRAKLDEDYTPEEQDEIDRKLWEKLRKAVLAGDVPDPSVLTNIQESLIENQARLGEMDAEGRFYTLSQFAGDINTLTKPLPDDMLHENYNFSDLVLFYKECDDSWEELYKVKSSPASLRKEWRQNHVDEEAMLLFWGKYSQSVFARGSPQWLEVSDTLKVWFDLYGIDKRMHKEWADWTLPAR